MFSPLESVLEVLAEFDHFSAPTAHRRILLSAVAVRNHDHGPESGTDSGKGNTLTKVAPRGCDHSSHLRIFALKLRDIEQCTSDFERANRRMVLLLHPHVGFDPLNQYRPPDLSRPRQDFFPALRR